MTEVITEGGRTVDLDAYQGDTIGDVADAIANVTYHGGAGTPEGHVFSFKVNGHVADVAVSPTVLGEDDTIELVDVTEYNGAQVEETPVTATIPLGETGSIVTDTPLPANGTRDDILAWVADDPGRARVALEIELQKEKPRKTLVDELAPLAARANSSE